MPTLPAKPNTHSNNLSRCHRLGKECLPSTSFRKRTGRNPSKRTQLEDKLDDLVTLLRTQQQTGSGPSTTSPDSPSLLTPRSITNAPLEDSALDYRLKAPHLLEFRKHLAFFPFLDLPDITSLEQFQLERPYLSQAMHTLCTKGLSQQAPLAARLRATLATRIMAEGERSLDLLHSVIVCIAWYVFLPLSCLQVVEMIFIGPRSTYITHNKQFLGSMCSTARILLSDLRLDRPMNPALCPSMGPNMEFRDARTSEESRVLLAVFSMNAMYAE